MSEKQGHQIKALILKNLHLQKRQPCTNCCQIMTPIICLLLTIVIRNVAIANIPSQNDTIYGSYPLVASKFNDYTFIDQLSDYIYRSKAQSYIFDYKNPLDAEFIGTHDGSVPPTGQGLLGLIPKTYPRMVPFNSSMRNRLEYKYSPDFQRSNGSIAGELFSRYQFLNSDTFQSLRRTSSAQKLPEAAIYFQTANEDKLEATLRIKDVRQFLFYRANGVTQISMKKAGDDHYNHYFTIPQGFLSVMDMISSAYVKLVSGSKIISGYTYMPFNEQGGIFVEMLINTVATIIFPLSLSLLLPVFLYLIVLEKEERLIQMMRMNGMKITNYWAINFLYNFAISVLTNLVFYGFGFFFLENSFFKEVAGSVVIVVFLGWILSQIGMAMFFQVFLSGSAAANIIGYLVAIWTNLIGATLNIALFQYPRELPLGFAIWPTFSFDRLFYLIFSQCSIDQCPKSLDSLTPQMRTCITVLYVSFVVFALLGMYLHQIVPQQFGVRQPILFPIYFIMELFTKQENEVVQNETSLHQSDSTIDQECIQIGSIENVDNYPLICNGVTKKYKNGKLAVNNFNLIVEDKTIFGLLGPNGAGKTTLLSMITGIFSPTRGNALVGGYSIKNQIDKVHLEMGVCPQFDILWPILTVQEHLYFYARLRGIGAKSEKIKVEETLAQVNLIEQRNYKVNQLSGGMKRRLSIGISLVGDPRIVFMDEPTTGLDPENRRHLWEVLSKCRQKRSIFLTTHMMEEAQSLCDKIGIITQGNLRTVGDQFKLKEIYGRGYFISINVELQKGKANSVLNNSNDDGYESLTAKNNHVSIMTEQLEQEDYSERINAGKVERLRSNILRAFPKAIISKQISGMIKLNVTGVQVSEILHQLSGLKEADININFDWAISSSTLEDVFLEVILRFQKQKQNGNSDNYQGQIR